jgi:hypothetical protein
MKQGVGKIMIAILGGIIVNTIAPILRAQLHIQTY